MRRLRSKEVLLAFLVIFFVFIFTHIICINQYSDIHAIVKRINDRQTIKNEEIFGPFLNDSLVIVVQVHNRINYLRHHIVSLSKARDIDKVLLIFSHDFYDDDINELIRSIDFCKVMQIFYPFSYQLHPVGFPGHDQEYCPPELVNNTSYAKFCKKSPYPELYSSSRDAFKTQTKHHWWWKANRVFDQLEVTKHHPGLVLFLEEDHYVAEDFLHVLRLMQEAANKSCENCHFFSMGNGFSKLNNLTFDKVKISNWIDNMGLAISRTGWTGIKTCAIDFCAYNDYNWDWSLQYLNYECMNNKYSTMTLQGQRVFHIGECGMHHSNKDCDVNEMLMKVEERLNTSRALMFPKEILITSLVPNNRPVSFTPFGAWSDIRDVILCLNMCLP